MSKIWDLLTVFNQLLASVGKQRASHEVVYDDTPITLHAADILDQLTREGSVLHSSGSSRGGTAAR